MSYFPRAGHASSPASVRSLKLGAGTALSSWPRCPDPLASAASLSAHSSVCLGLPGASGTQKRSQPPGALVQAATPGGLAGLTASPADRGRRRAPGVAGRARRPSEGLAVHVGLGPGLRGEGIAAGRGRGRGCSTQPGSRGSRGLCARLSPRNTRGQAAWTPGTGGHPRRHPPMVEGGSDLGEPARCRPQPPAELTQPWRLTGGDRPLGRLSCKAWLLMPCVPTAGPAWPRPGGC